MVSKSITKILCWTLALPLVGCAKMCIFFNIRGIKADLERCIVVVDQAPRLPPGLFPVLVAAEDHRNALHPGIDPISLGRVAYVWVFARIRQGGSTIEQQFVRVVTGRYEISARRKLREQVLAIAIASRRSKELIGNAYLSVAYYGSGKVGTNFLSLYLMSADADGGAALVARLKYPEPSLISQRWGDKIQARVSYIKKRLNFDVQEHRDFPVEEECPNN